MNNPLRPVYDEYSGGRTPYLPRQLNNLTDLPTASDPAADVVPVSHATANAGNLMATTEFPKLLWCIETSEEVTIHTPDEERRMLAGGYTATPPAVVTQSPADALRAKIEALSPDERKTVIENQRNSRLKALQEEMSNLSPEALDSILGPKPAPPVPHQPRRK